MTIGNKVKEARISIGLTQEQVAEKLMVSRQTISNWETCKSLPDILNLIKMSELYKISLDELLKEDSDVMRKIEKDVQLAKCYKKTIKFAGVSIMIGIVLIILDAFFEGNSIINFLKGATPWILLGLSFLFAFLYLDKQEEK